MKLGRLATLAAIAAIGSVAVYQVPVKAGWGASFACGAGAKTDKINWDSSVETPTDDRGVATGEGTPAAPQDEDLTTDLEALAKARPMFIYYFVQDLQDKNDKNFSFASKFEQGVLVEESINFLNKYFVCKKVGLPADADLKDRKNQARIEVWSPTKKKLGTIGLDETNLLNKSSLLAYLRVRIARSQKLVKDEIARVEKVRKDREEMQKKESAKNDE